ncbi:MAG: HD domain-containing protein [Desulfomonilaceae bacterium]
MFEPYEHIYALAKPYLDTRDNELHTRIAFGFAKRLLASEGGSEAVVLPAILLHDVGWKSLPEELHLKAFGPRHSDKSINRVHEVEGAKIARQILEQVAYDAQLIHEIVSIISGHDSRLEPLSLNDAIVKDSDKLWRFSKEALEVDPKRFSIRPEVHTKWLGLQIEKWFLTKTGKEIAYEEYRQRALFYGVSDAE